MGPWVYAKHLVSGSRLPFTAAYFGSIALTLYFAVGVSTPSTGLLTPYPPIPIRRLASSRPSCRITHGCLYNTRLRRVIRRDHVEQLHRGATSYLIHVLLKFVCH